MRPVVLSPHGPMLEAGAPPRGRFVDSIWQGETEWCTRHGDALVQWRLGQPTFVWRALTQEGQRIDVESRAPASMMFRYQVGEALVHGMIEIRDDEVAFTQLTSQPSLGVDKDLKTLVDVLRADPAFVCDLEASAFASALYQALENTYVRTPSGVTIEFGQRSAAHCVAALRNAGEDYLDYAWGRGGEFSAADTARVVAHFSRLGIVVEGEATT